MKITLGVTEFDTQDVSNADPKNGKVTLKAGASVRCNGTLTLTQEIDVTSDQLYALLLAISLEQTHTCILKILVTPGKQSAEVAVEVLNRNFKVYALPVPPQLKTHDRARGIVIPQ
jgi:hypothetical protein